MEGLVKPAAAGEMMVAIGRIAVFIFGLSATMTTAELACVLNHSPAQMWRNDVGDIDVVDATQEGCSDDHQYEHEPKKKRSFHEL